MTQDREALVNSLNSLILDTHKAQSRFDDLQKVLRLALSSKLQLLSTDTELNPLLERLIRSPQDLEPLLDLINSKRRASGLLSLVVMQPEEAVERDRKDYLAEKMSVKRARERRLLDAWNSMLPEARKLRGSTAAAFKQNHANRWIEAKGGRRDALVKSLGRLPRREELRDMESEFWNDVEDEIFALEQFAKEEMSKSVSNRSPNGFAFKIKRS